MRGPRHVRWGKRSSTTPACRRTRNLSPKVTSGSLTWRARMYGLHVNALRAKRTRGPQPQGPYPDVWKTCLVQPRDSRRSLRACQLCCQARLRGGGSRARVAGGSRAAALADQRLQAPSTVRRSSSSSFPLALRLRRGDTVPRLIAVSRPRATAGGLAPDVRRAPAWTGMTGPSPLGKGSPPGSGGGPPAPGVRARSGIHWWVFPAGHSISLVQA